jgi:hypothetical protein
MAWTKLPVEVPRVLLQRVPDRRCPFSILTTVSPGVLNPISTSECQAENLIRLICLGMIKLKTCFPVHISFGFNMAGVGIFPSKSSHHIKIFINTSCGRNMETLIKLQIPTKEFILKGTFLYEFLYYFTFSMNVSLLEILKHPRSVSWTIPITGRLDCGETMHFGTIISSRTSALVSND